MQLLTSGPPQVSLWVEWVRAHRDPHVPGFPFPFWYVQQLVEGQFWCFFFQNIGYKFSFSRILPTTFLFQNIGYNFTRLPNQFNHETQEEVKTRPISCHVWSSRVPRPSCELSWGTWLRLISLLLSSIYWMKRCETLLIFYTFLFFTSERRIFWTNSPFGGSFERPIDFGEKTWTILSELFLGVFWYFWTTVTRQ